MSVYQFETNIPEEEFDAFVKKKSQVSSYGFGFNQTSTGKIYDVLSTSRTHS